MLRDEELDEDQYWFLKSSRISAETVRDTGEKKVRIWRRVGR